MDVVHSCRCCLRRAPDKDLTTTYTHLGTTEIYSDMLKECFEIHLILNSDEEVGICDVCVGRLRDASNFKLQVQHSQIELQAWLQRALQVKEEDPADEAIMEDGDGSSEEPVLCEEPPVKTETEDEHGASDEEGQELSQDEPAVGAGMVNDDAAKDAILYEARAVKADVSDVSDDDDEDCISRQGVWRGGGAATAAHTGHARHMASTASSRPGHHTRASGEEPLVKTETEDEHGASDEEGQELSQDEPAVGAGMVNNDAARDAILYEARAVKADVSDVSDDDDEDCISLARGGGARPVSARAMEQLAMACSVRLERLRGHEAPHASQACLATSRRRPRPDTSTPHTCDICQKQFTRKDILIRHIRTHTGERPYTCNVCSKTFADSSTLRQHQRIHTGDKRYICNICDKRFTQQGNLITHIRTHTGQRPYTCNVCSKTFLSSSHLRSHQQIHTGDERYTCSICDKWFTRKGDLISHIRTHTGQRPYTCNVCSKTFAHSSHLRSHQRIHTGDKRYTCSTCDKRFTQKSNLTRHIRTHTAQ